MLVVWLWTVHVGHSWKFNFIVILYLPSPALKNVLCRHTFSVSHKHNCEAMNRNKQDSPETNVKLQTFIDIVYAVTKRGWLRSRSSFKHVASVVSLIWKRQVVIRTWNFKVCPDDVRMYYEKARKTDVLMVMTY